MKSENVFINTCIMSEDLLRLCFVFILQKKDFYMYVCMYVIFFIDSVLIK